MARGRMIDRSLWSSKRFAALVAEHGPWAGLVYIAHVTATDSAGRLEADGDSLADLLARTARSSGVGTDELRRLSVACAQHNLIRRWGSGVDEYAEVIGFSEHNRIRDDREAPSRIPNPPPLESSSASAGGLREYSGSTPAGSAGVCGSTPAGSAGVCGSTPTQVQVQVQEEAQDEAQERETARARARSNQRAEEPASRLRAAYARACEAESIIPGSLKPREEKAVESAVRLCTCDAWTYPHALIAEFRRTIRGLKSKGLPVNLVSVIDHVGEEWSAAPGRPDPMQNGAAYDDGATAERLRLEMDAIEREERAKKSPATA